MLVNFKSLIKNQGNHNKIDFTSEVAISKYNEFDVYEFVEPSKGEMNRIEVSESKVNIMAGPSTLEMELNNPIDILYQVQSGQNISLRTLLKKIDRKENKISFVYTLSNNSSEIGEYHISLEFK